MGMGSGTGSRSRASGNGSAGKDSGGDYVTVYHRTSAANADAIERDGFKPSFNATSTTPEYAAYNSQYVFVTKRPNAQRGYGDHLVTMRVKRSELQRDPGSGHYRVPVKALTRASIVKVEPSA